MLLWNLFKTNPMSAIALIVALVTLFGCLRMLRRQHTKIDRYLMGLLGAMSLYQGLTILQNAGIYTLGRLQGVNGAMDLTMASMCMASILILRVASRDRHNTKLQLRVAEANQTLPLRMRGQLCGERSAVAVLGVNASGEINLWHTSSEDFFGWRKEEVLGTRLPFDGKNGYGLGDTAVAGPPRKLRLVTRFSEELDALVWLMPTPDEGGSLVIVLDYERVRKPVLARPTRQINIARPQLTTAV